MRIAFLAALLLLTAAPVLPACHSEIVAFDAHNEHMKSPKPMRIVNPSFPDSARRHGGGVVIMEAVIDETGALSDICIVKSVPELDQAAMDAVRQWTFQPGTIDRKATTMRYNITINFKEP